MLQRNPVKLFFSTLSPIYTGDYAVHIVAIIDDSILKKIGKSPIKMHFYEIAFSCDCIFMRLRFYAIAFSGALKLVCIPIPCLTIKQSKLGCFTMVKSPFSSLPTVKIQLNIRLGLK